LAPESAAIACEQKGTDARTMTMDAISHMTCPRRHGVLFFVAPIIKLQVFILFVGVFLLPVPLNIFLRIFTL
jgi:hypothetical protein